MNDPDSSAAVSAPPAPRSEKAKRAPPAPRPLFSLTSRAGRIVQLALIVLPVGFFVAGVVLSERARVYKYEDVARRLRTERHTGDLIALGAGVPTGPFAKLANVVEARELPVLPPVAFRSVFVLSNEGGDAPTQVGGVPLPPPFRTRTLGPLRVTQHTPTPQSFFDALHGATVRFVHKDGRVDTCRGMRTGEFDCPSEGWIKVGTSNMGVRGRYLDCINAHPSHDGSLHILFPPMRVGEKVVFRTALADTASLPPVHVEVRGPNHQLGIFDHKSAPGWEAHDLPSGALAGQEVPIEVILTVPGPGRSHFCFSGGT